MCRQIENREFLEQRKNRCRFIQPEEIKAESEAVFTVNGTAMLPK